MNTIKDAEAEWASYAPPDAKYVQLHVVRDLRHDGVYLLSPEQLPSPRTESVAGLLGRDNMFRPTNARYAYGVLPAWNDQTNGPDHGDLFAKDDIREAILIDLQGFPNDLAAPSAVFRLRPIIPWGTCLREGFLKAGSEQAQLQLKQMASELEVGVGEELKVGV